MKIISWNVNGVRAIVKKNFTTWLFTVRPDILCLQETKIAAKDIAKKDFDFPGYEEYWHPAERPGYSGTAILIKNELINKLSLRGETTKQSNKSPNPLYQGGFSDKIWNGFGIKKFDQEGRVQTLDMGKFYVVNIYFPNANHELSRLQYKLEFNKALLKYLKKLEKTKPIIICGDFNVAHEEIDLARPKDNVGNPGFTDEERAWMTKFLRAGFVDIWRHKYPKKIQYSWWSYRFGARARNIGWRIDYFCASKKLLPKIKNAFISDQVPGSDHCPVGIELEL